MVVESSALVALISTDVSLDKSEISVLKVRKVSEERSLISADVSLLISLISLESSLEVYDDRSEISCEARD